MYMVRRNLLTSSHALEGVDMSGLPAVPYYQEVIVRQACPLQGPHQPGEGAMLRSRTITAVAHEDTSQR